MNPEKVLPPGVNGKITGYLMVKVDEIFWTRNSPGDVFVQLQWWGEKDSSLFRPEDVTLNEPKKSDNTSITYTIRTSPGLFESYLRNCGRITFTVLRGQNKNVILGTAVVKDVEQIISLKNYHSYFSIFSPKGNRIGDLHICFEITLKHIETHFTLKHSDERCKVKPQNSHKSNNVQDQQSNTKCKSVSSQEDKLLSNILQKGHELRKAMVMSVLADCPVDNLESVVNYNSQSSSVKQDAKKEEAKLIDFLLGKYMSAEEEMKALETLRCISPAENLVEITKEEKDAPTITMAKCCLHGQECEKKSTNVETWESKPNEGSSERISTASSKHMKKTEEKNQNIEGENIVKKNVTKFNCYRIIISTVKLTVDGSRKIFYMPGIKEISKHNVKYGRNHNPPGTSFILEITLPSKSGGIWSKRIKFVTKNFKGHCVDFSQGTTHRLCGSVTWSRIRSLLIGSIFTIYWRHLNQRVPCPLGSTKLEELSPETGAESLTLCLPVYSNTRLLTGYLNVTISLGALESLGDEAMFHIEKKKEEKNENIEDLDSIPSRPSLKMCVEPPICSPKSDSPLASESENIFPVPSLDEELIRTINLLNSKPDDIPKKIPAVERQEACVQTTLPLTKFDCPACHCQRSTRKEDNIEPWIEKKNHPKDLENKFEDSNHSKKQLRDNVDTFNELERNFINSKSNLYNDYVQPNLEFSCAKKDSGISPLPVEFECETIHEFSMKIEKVVGIPLFNGDNDLDCYVDYNFPKVDHNGRIVFDRITNGTDIRMALRETEFGKVNHHRLRLKCKLTKALLALPVHEIAFNIWGRYYRPTPRDYKLGKATIPLMKLSTLELVYCQQMKKEPIFERIIIPITVVQSSVTSGYQGSFGHIHIVLGYSCTSGRTYREWREQGKDCNYLYNHQTSGNLRTESDSYNPIYATKFPRDNSNQCKNLEDKIGISFPDEMNRLSQIVQDSRINSRNKIFSVSELIQSNFNEKNIEKGIGNKKDKENHDVLSEVSKEIKTTMQNENHYDSGACHEYNHFNTKKPSDEKSAGLGSTVAEVLLDMKERQVKNSSKPKNKVHTITSNPLSAPMPVTLGGDGDAFESFNLRENLPSREDSMNFEARSQYSFLCSPPPIPHLVPNQNNDVVLESDSSCSIIDGIQDKNAINPFSSLSNMSFSINSDSSMFRVQENDNPLRYTRKDCNSDKKTLPINEPIVVKSSLSETFHAEESLNKKNAQKYQESKTVQKNPTLCDDSDKEDVVSSDATLKSVESLKSYKEDLVGRESKDVGVETDFVTQHKDTQTSYTSYKEEQYFKARVQICRALSLPSVEVRQPSGKIGLVKPSSYAYFSARMNGKSKVLKTEVIEKKCNPIWNASWNVELPVDFLKKCDRELEIFVDLNNGAEEPARGSDCSSQWPIVLRTGVDLTPITAGLEHASGWFSLSDRSLLSRAQLKVVVTPLEDVSRFRDDWLKEYTKAKGRKIDINVPHSSSIATSLQEKLKELEKLTECMRNKMDEQPNWNRSPPFDLLSRVQDIRFSQDEISLQPPESWSGTVQRVETATSPIVVNLAGSSHSPDVILHDEEEDKSLVKTYTFDVESESSQHDSLETPSETIDRILTKMRSKK